MSRATSAKSARKKGDPKQPKRLDFNSHTYDKVIENCFGKDIRNRARALLKTSEYQEKITRNLQIADQYSDGLALRMRQDPRVKADYELAIRQGIDAVDDPCDELIAFMDHAVNIPDYFDRELIESGARVFLTRLNPITFFAYGWPGAALQSGVLGITAAGIMTNQPKGQPMTLKDNWNRPDIYERLAVRFMETFKWFASVAQPGAGQPYSSAFRESCRVRIIHSHIRNGLQKNLNKTNWNFDPPIGWQEDELGTPLSGADGSVVVTTMATAILMAAKNMDIPLTGREKEALFQFTSYLNYMQGVPEELLFPDAEETAVYFSAFLMSINTNCRRDWVEAFFYGVLNMHLEKALFPDSKLAQHLLDGMLRASWNEIYDKRFRRLYNMPSDTHFPYRMMFKATKTGFRLYNRVAKHSPWLQARLDDFGMMLWNDIFPSAEEKIKLHYGAVAEGTELAHT